ncbi:hypothetical protein SASPL_103573 [Salvia splendens]|uniref:Prolyl endopeptidase n=1 Tax=Salvia splendens TaxID=180675 RepID=A0A8X8YL89_SALSN|nr:hypothetical protein SASPL_103573 [Salvia splendens]
MKLTDSVLNTCETREKLREKLTKLSDFPKYNAPFRVGDKNFYFHNTGLQPQTVLYVQGLDPNTLSDDGTVALSEYAVSEDGKYLAYGTSSSGSDWVITIKVIKIDDKTTEPDVKFSGTSWTHDGKGFFYSRYPAPNFLVPGMIYMCKLEGNVPDMRVFREIMVPGFDRTEFEANQFGDLLCQIKRKNLQISRGIGYGEEWHKAGALAKKQNCFDDFISAAEYLVSAGYTQPAKLCIEGGSNGGLLVGACINQIDEAAD